MTAIPILFEDGEALVIDKPAGLPLDRPRAGGPCLEDYLDELKLGFQRAPVPVHRLDQDTSGCLLLARNPKALKRFSAAFEARQVEKLYLGIVAGRLEPDSGTISLSLAKISSAEKGWRMIPAKKGKPSITHWRKLEERGGLTLVEFRPETGRTHQLRVHLAWLGCPVVGDRVYGRRKQRLLTQRQFLHAQKLELAHPITGAPLAIAAPLPDELTDLLRSLRR